MSIHKEGYKTIILVFILLFLFCITVWLIFSIKLFVAALAASFLIFIFILRFFREPKRSVSKNIENILSPADGTVVAIEEVDETEFLKTRCIQISVFMSVWNVHINWYPLTGIVKYFRYHPGKYLVAWHPKSSTLNERTTVAVERHDGVTILFRQIAGLLARRVVCYAKEGAEVVQGQQVGFIKFGSRVDIFIPISSVVKVDLNQKVTGNETLLAVLPLVK
jgi:phosphatidylserine decarboxylase